MYELTIGIHCGTITSRDIEEPKQLETMEDCITEVKRAEENYAKWGYVIWFADVITPEGKIVNLDSNSNYR